MKHYNPLAVMKLPLSTREKNNDNRNQIGFHVFLLRFFVDFKQMDTTQQQHYLADVLRIEGFPSIANYYYAVANDDDAYIDSTDSSICVRHQDVMRAACLEWNNSSEAVKNLWKSRAEYLNTLPVPGQLNTIAGTRRELETTMIQATYLDWKNICLKIQQSIKTKPRNEQSNMIVHFGEERVVIRSQTSCRMV